MAKRNELPQIGPNGCNIPCYVCRGISRVKGCPLGSAAGDKAHARGSVYVELWPEYPSDDASWFSDTPNEGIAYDGEAIISHAADYHGYYLVAPGERVLRMPSDKGLKIKYFGDHGKPGSATAQYGEAYKALAKALRADKVSSLLVVMLNTLLPMGWRPVRPVERLVKGASMHPDYPCWQYHALAPCFQKQK